MFAYRGLKSNGTKTYAKEVPHSSIADLERSINPDCYNIFYGLFAGRYEISQYDLITFYPPRLYPIRGSSPDQ